MHCKEYHTQDDRNLRKSKTNRLFCQLNRTKTSGKNGTHLKTKGRREERHEISMVGKKD